MLSTTSNVTLATNSMMFKIYDIKAASLGGIGIAHEKIPLIKKGKQYGIWYIHTVTFIKAF